MKFSWLLFGLIFLYGCSVTRQTENAFVVISVEKLPCMGNCPAYKLRIYNNHIAIYEGKENVDKIGVYTTKISNKKFSELQEAFLNSDFFEMKDVYSAHIMDLQTTYIYFKLNEKEKKILDYYDGPKVLKDLVNIVEELNEQNRWKKVK